MLVDVGFSLSRLYFGILMRANHIASFTDAIKVGLSVEPYKPLFFEEPVPPEDFDGMFKVSQILIAASERLYTR